MRSSTWLNPCSTDVIQGIEFGVRVVCLGYAKKTTVLTMAYAEMTTVLILAYAITTTVVEAEG